MQNVKRIFCLVFAMLMAAVIFSAPSFSKPISAPPNIQPLLDEAKKLLDQSNYDDAIAKLNEAVAQDKKSAPAYRMRGEAYVGKGNYDLAIEDLNRAIELDAKDADAYVARGNAYYNQTKDDRALADYEKAISLDGSNPEAYYRRGKLHEVRGEYDAALEDYTKSLSFSPKNLSLYDGLIYIYNNQKKYDKTAEVALKAVDVYPDDSLYRKNLGDAYIALGQWDNALAAYAKAMKLSNTYEPDYYGTEGLIYQKKGNTEQALKSYTQAIDKGKSSGSSGLATYFTNRGFIFFDGKKFEEALMDFQDAALSNTSSSEAYFGLALTYYKMKLVKLTRKAMDKTLELEPGYKDIENYMKEKGVSYTKSQLDAFKEIKKQFGY